MTEKRIAICNIVKSSDKHLTASEIAEIAKAKIGNIALATIYNNLNALVDEGLIGRWSYAGVELYDKYPHSHAHIVCKKCGEVKDIAVGSLKSYLSEKTEEEIEGFSLFMTYICEKCRGKDKK